MTKRVLAFLMVIAMVFSLIPTVVVAEEAESAAAFEVIIQKSHNQTGAEGTVDVDIYLQAAAAAEVTAFQVTFDKTLEVVATEDGMQGTAVNVDAEGNEIPADDTTTEPAGTATKLVYPPEEAAIPVGTGRTLLATVNAATLADVAVSYVEVSVEGGYYANVAGTAEQGYLGEAAVEALPYACDGHDCGHGTGTWTGVAALSGELAAGNYYLTSDVALTGKLDVAADAEVTVCLNGYSITAADGTRMFELTKAGATLNICDCTATGEGAAYTAGKLLPKHNQGGALRSIAAENVTINFYGGIIDGTNSNKKEASVALIRGSTLNMLGGKVENFDAGLLSSGNHYGPIIVRGKKDGADGVATIADVTFVNCGSAVMSGAPGDGDRADGAVLTVEDVTVLDSASGAYAVEIKDRFKSVTLKGDCDFDAPVYVEEGETVTLALGQNADVNIVTETELTEEQFNEQFKMAEGGSLTDGTLLYETNGVFVTYDAETGLFAFQEGHTIRDKHAAGIVFKAWDKTDSLPKEGNWYLLNNVTVSESVNVEDTLNLDLNGKTVTTTEPRFFTVYVGVLNLFDGTSTFDDEGNWTAAGTGKFTGFNKNNQGSIVVQTGGVMNLYSAVISGNSGNNGPAVYLYATHETRKQNGAVFNMYGGEISGNTSTTYGAVAVQDFGDVPEGMERGKINIYGGKISGNTGNLGTFRLPGNVDVTVSGGEFTGNTVTGTGGVFYMGGDATVTVTGGKFNNNSANNGGVFQMGDSSQVKISGGEFTQNSATANGGVMAVRNSSVLDICGGEFKTNSANQGGVIYIAETAQITTTAEKPNSLFDGNTGSGGMMFGEGTYKASITGATIQNNSTSGFYIKGNAGSELTLIDCQVIGNTSSGVGSAINMSGSVALTLDDTIITGNNCTNGAQWYNSSAIYVMQNNAVTLSGATVVAGNTATASTANPYWQDLMLRENNTAHIKVNELTAGAHINVWNLAAESLTAPQLVTVADGGDQTDWDCGWINYYESASNQSATVGVCESVSRIDGVFTFGHYHGDQEYTAVSSVDEITGAGYYYLANNITTSASWTPVSGVVLCFAGHTIKSSVAKVVNLDDATNNPAITVTFEDCTGTYLENGEYIGGGLTSSYTTNKYGTGVYVNNSNAVVNWNGGKIFGINTTGTSELGGTAIYIKTGTVNFNNGAICNNTMTISSSSVTSSIQGIIQINGGKLDINGGSFYENTTSTAGTGNAYGVIRRAGGTITIDDAKFFDNTAKTAAAVYGAATVKNCEFRGNTATGNGGAVYGSGTYTNCVFEGNTAGGSNGGGAIVVNGTTTFSGCTFSENSATSGKGGAIFETDLSGTITITDCEFIGNTSASNGGALNAENGSATIDIKGSDFVENKSDAFGGAICTRGNNMKLTIAKNTSGVPCTFTGNTAKTKGGAICFDTYNRYTNTRTINDAVFTGNSAPDGGAVWLNCSSHASNTGVLTTTITGSTFTENSATTAGSAISMNGYSATTLDSCTVTDNTDEQFGAIFVQTGTCDVTLTGKMTVKDNANGLYEQANLYMRGDNTTNLPYVAFTGLHPESVIGINAPAVRCEGEPVVSEGAVTLAEGYEDNDVSKCFFSGDESRFITYIDGEGQLILTKFVAEDGTPVGDMNDLIESLPDTQTDVTLQTSQSDAIIDLTDSQVTTIDLNGNTVSQIVVPAGKELELKDTTSDFNTPADEIVKVQVSGEGTVKSEFESDGKRYMVVTDDEGYASVHRVHLTISSRLLRPATFGAGFKANFYTDEVLSEKVTYGVLFSFYEDAEGNDFESRETTSWFGADFYEMQPGYEAGVKPNQKILAVTNLLTDGEDKMWDQDLYGVPFVNVGGTITHEEIDGKMYSHISGGTTLYGTKQTVNMKALAKKAFQTGGDTVAQKVADMLIAKGLDGSVFEN